MNSKWLLTMVSLRSPKDRVVGPLDSWPFYDFSMGVIRSPLTIMG